MSTARPQQLIVEACELELERHGDNFRGAGYTQSADEAASVYDVMLGVVRESSGPLTLLDLGCGLAHLLDRLRQRPELDHVEYSGLDLSASYIEVASAKHPDTRFFEIDILEAADELPAFDYIVMNGIFNYRGDVPFEEMLDYWQRMVSLAFARCRRGIAFNVMSKMVDWEREDLFHLPFDTMAHFVSHELSRHLQVRADYGAFEYTTYVYREPADTGALRGEHALSSE